MKAPPAALPASFAGLLALLLSSLLAFVLVALSDAKATWAVLCLFALIATGTLVWFKNPKTVLLALLLFLVPITLSKALTSEHSTYGPALSLELSDLALLPLLALWIGERLLVLKTRPYWTPTHRIALLFTGWMLIEAAISPVSAAHFIVVNHVKYFLYLVVIAEIVRDRRVLRIALSAIAAGLGVQLVMASLQLITGSDLSIPGGKPTDLGRLLVFEQAGGLHFRRLSGFLPHPNVFADYLTFLLPPLVAMLLCRRGLGRAFLPVLALALGALAALILALSRGAWVSFACSMIFVLASGWRVGLVTQRQLAAVLLSGMLALSGIVAVFPAAIYRITNSDARSSDSRIAMMDQAMLIIADHPVFGVGLAAYNKTAQTTIPNSFAGLLPAFRDTLLKGVVHNKYLLTLAELGIVGWLLQMAFLVSLVRIPFRPAAWRNPAHFALALGLSGSVVAQMVFYLFDHFSYDVRLAMLYATAGLLLGLTAPPGNASDGRPPRASASDRSAPGQSAASRP